MRRTLRRPGCARWRVALGLLAGAALLAPRFSAAQPKEYEVKAAFLLSFAKFVEWPAESFASPDSPIVLAVAGDDPFGEALDRVVQGRTAQGRRFTIRRFHRADRLERCHILFIGGSEDPGEWLAAVQRGSAEGVLTVGEGRDFCRRGAISFLIEQRRVHLAVNLDEVAHSRLRVSSKLLALAEVVGSSRGEVGP